MSPRGEWLALLALLAPWLVLSAFLPPAHAIVSAALLSALGALLACALRWSRMRAEALGLPAEPWGLAAVLTLGYSQALLVGMEGRSGFDALCHECGRLQDVRLRFCQGCGSYGA